MKARSGHLMLVGAATLLLWGWVTQANAGLTSDQVSSLFLEANEAFRRGNAESDPEQRRLAYQQAILRFERIIEEGEIENPKLYYNLANACLLNDQIGKAILNYRRALRLDESDTNIQKNLAFARSRRIDKVAVQTEKKVLQTLFFWHYDVPLSIRFFLVCFSFGLTSALGIVVVLRGFNSQRALLGALAGALTLCFLVSVIVEVRQQQRTPEGVILEEEVVARQGDGNNYPPSFKDPLHAGTEFVLVEARSSWLQIRLSDGSEGWIPDQAAEII